jgi:hypothetical protein
MKTKIYKLLSILLALAILATTSLAITGVITVAAEDAPATEGGAEEIVYPENSYFISSKGKTVPANKRPEGLGTLESPVKTFSDVTKLIKADGYGADDTVYVFIKSGEQVEWKDLVSKDTSNAQPEPLAYDCNLIIDSTNPEIPGTLYEYDFWDAAGDMTFKNVNFTVEYMYGCARAGHHNIIFDKGSVVSVPEFFIGAKNAVPKYEEDFNLEIKGQFKAGKFFIMSYFGSGAYNGDINILVDNENAIVPLLFTGFRETNRFVYNGNININVLNAKTLSLGTYLGTSTFNGALHIMASSKVNLPYSVKTNFDNFNFKGGKWYITADSVEPDFVQLGATKGIFNIKNKAKAYVRQYKGNLITETDGVIDLSAKSGAYTISDKKIDEIKDSSKKMCYFKGVGGTNYVMSRAEVTPLKTYRLEYSIFTSHIDDAFPTCRVDGDRKAIGDDMVVISNKQIDNRYYRVVAEITIPETYYNFEKDKNNLAFFGVCLAPSSQGVVFDWTVYDVEDTSKTNLLRNAKFHDGLDQIALNFDFWGGVYTDERGGSGLLDWTNGIAEIAVKDYDVKFIDHLIYLADPDDGKWWNDKDIHEENFETYGKAVGIFRDQDGNPLKGYKFMLVSAEGNKTYTAKTNSKGEFNFGEVLSGIYELFIVDGDKKVQTDFADFIAQYDFVKFDITTDMSGIVILPEEPIIEDTPIIEEPEQEEVIPTGNFTGTIYTPMLEVVTQLRVTLGDIGDVVTDDNGSFAFANIPVGTYDLYTILEDGSKYVITQVTIQENCDIASKLKFAPPVETDNETEPNNGWIIWVIVASAVALVVVAGLIFLLVFKNKKRVTPAE